MKPNEQQAPDKRLAEIQRRYKQGETAWHLNDIALLFSLLDDAHVRNAEDQDEHSQQRAKLAKENEELRADRLQQPTSERCGECGHSDGIDADGVCKASLTDGCSCGCKCVFPTTGAPNRDGSMTPAQLERAALIAKSRGIDLETAQELVYLRDVVATSGADEGAGHVDGVFDGMDCRVEVREVLQLLATKVYISFKGQFCWCHRPTGATKSEGDNHDTTCQRTRELYEKLRTDK